jgi:predicted nucleotidyltransferase
MNNEPTVRQKVVKPLQTGPAMTTADTIHEAVSRRAADPLPQRIIPFGSQIRGDADAGSDIDLLVIEREVPDRGAEMVRLRRLRRRLPAAFDVAVYTQDEVDRWGNEPGSALYWALKEGKVLHG